jgi:hypothetical protein
VEVALSQPKGNVSIASGSARAQTAVLECVPGVQLSWGATIDPSPGEFRGGLATASAQLIVLSPVAGARTVAETIEPVILKGGPRV